MYITFDNKSDEVKNESFLINIAKETSTGETRYDCGMRRFEIEAFAIVIYNSALSQKAAFGSIMLKRFLSYKTIKILNKFAAAVWINLLTYKMWFYVEAAAKRQSMLL